MTQKRSDSGYEALSLRRCEDADGSLHRKAQSLGCQAGWPVIREDPLGLLLHGEADGRSLSGIEMSSEKTEQVGLWRVTGDSDPVGLSDLDAAG